MKGTYILNSHGIENKAGIALDSRHGGGIVVRINSKEKEQNHGQNAGSCL